MIVDQRALKIIKEGIQLPNRCVLKLIPVDNLKYDHTYQRGTVKSTVDRIRREFDEDAVGTIEVGIRGFKDPEDTNELYVIDGQNRLEAIKIRLQLGLDAPKLIMCLCHPETTQKIEAKLFVARNTNKPVSGSSKFRANLVQEKQDSPENVIRKMVENEGFVLDFSSAGRVTPENTSINGIRSVATLMTVYKTHPNHIANAIKLLKLAYGNGNANMVPIELRTGDVVMILAKFLCGQVIKTRQNMTVLAREFKNRGIDLLWKVQQLKGLGRARWQQGSDWLTDCIGGTRSK